MEIDREREERIYNEIMPDAFGDEEEMISWHNYLSERLSFPFTAHCIVLRKTSPLEVGEKVKVMKMASEEISQREIFVLISWKKRQLAVPLMQLEGVEIDEEAKEAIEDWHYWIKRHSFMIEG